MASDFATPLARRKLPELIQERILEEIQSGRRMPGDLLPSERELMALYRVGRPAVREAMQNLQRMGLVQIRHGERPRVAVPSLTRAVADLREPINHLLLHSEGSLEHLKDARLLFETEMARIAARSRTPAHVEKLRQALEEQARARQPSPEFTALDGRFHHEIACVSGNPIFSALSEALFGWLASFHVHLVQSPGHESVTLQEHRQILDEIAAGNEEGAATEMRAHLNRSSALYRVPSVGRVKDLGPTESVVLFRRASVQRQNGCIPHRPIAAAFSRRGVYGRGRAGRGPSSRSAPRVRRGTGLTVAGRAISLAPVRQVAGKLVHVWAIEADIDPSIIRSNSFPPEWPPRSGQVRQFPRLTGPPGSNSPMPGVRSTRDRSRCLATSTGSSAGEQCIRMRVMRPTLVSRVRTSAINLALPTVS